MNLRTMLMVCVLSFSAVHVQAAPKMPSLQDVDQLAGRVNEFAGDLITMVANGIDGIGAYLNLCKPLPGKVIEDVLGHVANLNIGQAADTAAEGGKQLLNASLKDAPVTPFIKAHMTEAKIACGVVVTLATALVIKRVFFPKKSKKS